MSTVTKEFAKFYPTGQAATVNSVDFVEVYSSVVDEDLESKPETALMLVSDSIMAVLPMSFAELLSMKIVKSEV